MNSSWQSVMINNKRGYRLSALLRESAPHENSKAASCEENSLVIVCHGFTGSKEGGGKAIAMGEELAARGYSTLLFDFAGCGESEGNWHDLTLSGQVEDLSVMVQWGRNKGYDHIILNGRSFGGSTAISYAAEDGSIAGVCTWAAVARLEKLFFRYLQDRPEGPGDDLVDMTGTEGTLKIKRAFFEDLARHNLLSSAAAISPQRLLIVHGTADESVPAEDARLLFSAANEPKELKLIPGADHRFSEHTIDAWKAFFSWLEENGQP